MPQGNIKELNFEKPLDIKAYQYDIVCNGIEVIIWSNKKSYTRINV